MRFLAVLYMACLSQGAELPVVDSPHATTIPLITGDPLDPAWTAAPQIGALGPCLGQPATGLQATTVSTCWDAGFLYLRFNCTDAIPSPAPPATAPYTGDAVEVFLDAEGDARSYLELQVGIDGRRADHLWLLTAPARSEADGVLAVDLIKREQWQIPDWPCPGLKTSTRLVVGGWIADIALPAGPILRRSGAGAFAPMQLRINLLRLDYGVGPMARCMAWSPVAQGRPHRSPQACGTIHLVLRNAAAK